MPHMEAPPSISLIGWLHAAAYFVAMVSGALQFLGEKGTPKHRIRGEIYFYAMVIANFLVVFIYKMDMIPRPGQGPYFGPVFGVVHWLAMFTLALVVAGRFAASRQHRAFFAYFHPICMIVTYWFLLGGGINEAFIHIDWVREAGLAVSPGAQRIGQLKLLLVIQLTLDAFILIALVMAVLQVRRYRRRTLSGPDQTALTNAD